MDNKTTIGSVALKTFDVQDFASRPGFTNVDAALSAFGQ